MTGLLCSIQALHALRWGGKVCKGSRVRPGPLEHIIKMSMACWTQWGTLIIPGSLRPSWAIYEILSQNKKFWKGTESGYSSSLEYPEFIPSAAKW